MTDRHSVQKKKDKRQTLVYKTIHRQLPIEHRNHTKKYGPFYTFILYLYFYKIFNTFNKLNTCIMSDAAQAIKCSKEKAQKTDTGIHNTTKKINEQQ